MKLHNLVYSKQITSVLFPHKMFLFFHLDKQALW